MAEAPLPHAGPSFKPANRQRHNANQARYGSPLPIIIPPHPPSLLNRLGLVPRPLDIPNITGTYDPLTSSIIITDPLDRSTLFNRGFFGKGSLSRSEPTWRARRLAQLKGGSETAELIREKRRIERKAFKLARAEAMMDAARAAEAVLTSGTTPGEGETEVDVGDLTPQTFLVRPTRPDANRNRGRKAFKRRPPAPPAAINLPPPAETPPVAVVQKQEVVEDDEGSEVDEALVPDLEHLQLSYEEAYFLSAGIGVLRIYDPSTVRMQSRADTRER